ncbi:MAG: flagellar biosynthesis repressor FlbT [bacterium]
MPLKITLKPHEKVIIGDAVIVNGDSRSHFVIANNVPILKEKDIMREEEADSPCKRVYFVIQLMYIDDKNILQHHHTYWQLVKEVMDAAPSTLLMIDQISRQILGRRYYQALKLAKKLIEYEQEAIKSVRQSD